MLPLPTIPPKGNPIRQAISDAREVINFTREKIRGIREELKISQKVSSKVSHKVEPIEGVGACLRCWVNHLITVSGALSEALRFARSEGIFSPEVIKRVKLSLEELDIGERIDASPEEILKLPANQKEIMDWLLPKARDLRHHIEEIRNVSDLEMAAAMAKTLSDELFSKIWQCIPCGFVRESLKEFVSRHRKGVK